MKRQHIRAIVIILASLSAVVSMAFAAQDRFTLKAPNGVAFSDSSRSSSSIRVWRRSLFTFG